MKSTLMPRWLALAWLLPVLAHAAPISVTATGQVISSRDDMNLFGLGTGFNTLVGATITATWTFDSSAAGADIDPNPLVANYQPLSPWIESSVAIDTASVDSTFTVSQLITNPTLVEDQLYLENELHGGDGFDRYHVGDWAFDQSQFPNRYAYSWAEIHSWLDDLVGNFDPAQTFQWNATDSANDTGVGRFQYVNASNQTAYGNYSLTTFTVNAVQAVPEPLMGWVLLLTLLSGGRQSWRRRDGLSLRPTTDQVALRDWTL